MIVKTGAFLYRSYLLGHFRKEMCSAINLVIPSTCILMVLHVCHDHAMLDEYLAYKYTFSKIHNRFWFRALNHDVKTW